MASTKLAYLLHTVTTGGERLGPKQVAPVSTRDWDTFEKLGAIRTPTEQELDLYHLATGRKVAGPKETVSETEEPVKETKEPVTEDKVDLELESARKEADELGVSYRSNTGLKTLQKAIAEAKAKAKAEAEAATPDLTA